SSLPPARAQARQPRGQKNCFLHAASVGLALAGDIVRRATIHRTAEERRPQGQRHAAEKMMQLQGNQPLVVIHADDRVVVTTRGVVKQTVGGKGTEGRNSSPL